MSNPATGDSQIPVGGTKPGAGGVPSFPGEKGLRVSRWAKLKAWYRRKFIYFLIGGFVCVFLLVALWPRIFYCIESGHAGVLYRTFFGGTVTQTVRDEGLQIISPWNTLTIYDVRLQQIEQAFTVISSDGLEVKVVLSIRYHPKVEYLGLLHKKIGKDYVKKIVIPDVQSLVRTTFGQYTPEEIYTTKRSLIQEAFQKAIGHLGDNYVEMDDLLIKSITLPPGIQNAIESKLIEQQRSLAMRFRIERERDEAARKEIEAAGEDRFQRIVGQSLTPDLLKYRGISAMLRLAASPNAKVILTGGGNGGNVPLIMDMRSDQAVQGPLSSINNEGFTNQDLQFDEALSNDSIRSGNQSGLNTEKSNAAASPTPTPVTPDQGEDDGDDDDKASPKPSPTPAASHPAPAVALEEANRPAPSTSPQAK